MKLVSAVIVPRRFAAVQEALRTFGVLGLTVSEVLEQDGHRHGEVYRGRHFTVGLSPHVRLDILAHDSDAGDLVRIIRRVAAAQGGDGRVWVSAIECVVRVRTGHRGVDAL
jgi:nitrogen regulatory protein P-II 1